MTLRPKPNPMRLPARSKDPPTALTERDRKTIRNYMFLWFGPSAVVIAIVSGLLGFFVRVSLTQTHIEAVRQADDDYLKALRNDYQESNRKVIDILANLVEKTTRATTGAEKARDDALDASRSVLFAKAQATDAASLAQIAARDANSLTKQAYETIADKITSDKELVSKLGGAADTALRILQAKYDQDIHYLPVAVSLHSGMRFDRVTKNSVQIYIPNSEPVLNDPKVDVIGAVVANGTAFSGGETTVFSNLVVRPGIIILVVTKTDWTDWTPDKNTQWFWNGRLLVAYRVAR